MISNTNRIYADIFSYAAKVKYVNVVMVARNEQKLVNKEEVILGSSETPTR